MDGTREEAIDLREYLAILRARKWTIIIAVVVIAGAALALSYSQTPQFRAEARLLVRAVPTDTSGVVPEVNLATESQVIASQSVADRVRDELEVDLPAEGLLNNLAVQRTEEASEVLSITFTSPDPDLAADVANSFAQGYIELRRDQAAEIIDAGRQTIEDELGEARARLQEVNEDLQDARQSGSDTLVSTLESEQGTIIARLGVLEQRLDDYEVRQPLRPSGGEVIEPATTPQRPVSPDHPRNAALGIFIGAALGLGLAFLRERMDDRFRGRDDVVKAMGVPVLAAIPRFDRKRKSTDSRLEVLVEPKGRASEAFRNLRTSIDFIASQRSMGSILVTSPSPGEGKTMTTASLSVILAQAGRKVITVSADLRRPTLERYFGVDQEPGLTDWLITPDVPLTALVKDPGVPNLRIVPCGTIPSNPAEVLTLPQMTALVEELEANADVVLFDSPPVVPLADPIILMRHVDGVLLVFDANKTHRSVALHSKEALERVGGQIIGTVLNFFDPSGSPYYSYDYYYRSYEATPQPREKRWLRRADRAAK